MLYAYLIVSAATHRPIYAGQGSLGRAKSHTTAKRSIKLYNERTEVGLIITCGDLPQALEVEEKLIATYNPPFNKARWSTGGGLSPSAEARTIVSQKLTGTIRSLQTREKMSLSAKNRNPEHLRKIATANKGKKRTPEQRERMRSAHLGKTFSLETRKNMSIVQLGRKHRAEHTQKIREGVTRWWEQKKMAQLAEALLGA